MQLKDMAERLPVGTARTVKSPSSLNSFGSSPGRVDHFNILNRQNGQGPEPNTPMFSNGTTTPVFGNGEARNEAQNEKEWVEQDEPGVYITLTALAGGARDLKRVRFSRKKFSEKQAEQWWADKRGRVYEQYNVRIVDKASEEMPR